MKKQFYNLLGILLAILLLTPVMGEEPKTLSKSQSKWVEKTLKKMTLEERVGQLIRVSGHPSGFRDIHKGFRDIHYLM